MSSRQDQRVAEGATAIQSQRDTIVNQGLSSNDFRSIVESLFDQMPKFIETALTAMDVRLNAFEDSLIKRFDHDATAKREAFSDPDFLHIVIEAQRAYARTGDPETHGTLVDLIAKRSSEDTRSRRAFAINEAITVVSRLTKNDMSELAFAFYARHTKNPAINDLSSFCANLNAYIYELLDDLETDRDSYEYLVSQRCTAISALEISLLDIWRQVYPGLFMKGFSAEEVDKIVEDSTPDVKFLLTPSEFDPSRRRPRAISLEELLSIYRTPSVSEEHVRRIWSQAIASLADDDAIVQKLKPECPRIEEVIYKWNSSSLKSLDLTTIGKVIGHARLTQIPTFENADLSIWIK
ncbi:LPO_1073/Vpar_1526 family protein [Novosphingobium pokkalii]|uniref:LPO_1073/Vpar_1526 family protein n=1 Tax=Novosphingobium pokkalii TaxID=1770194 RepID=A0ABV7VB25_9SPHN|nr:LPO_1073/Vpar_1526 family protein [Novosphingobium pokkalii]GHC95157.1 hypothetical protein GCM10019060_23920 [Novosphingobium pokkalii]